MVFDSSSGKNSSRGICHIVQIRRRLENSLLFLNALKEERGDPKIGYHKSDR